MTPSLENFIVLTWLRLIHEDLPCLVKQRYGTELRSRTLASIKPEISQALDSLLNEVRSASEARVMRAATPQNFTHQPQSMSFPDVSRTHVKVKSPPRRPTKICPLCKTASRPHNHFLSTCTYLPESDRKYMVRARQIANIFEDSPIDQDFVDNECDDPISPQSASISLVQVRQSPYMDTFHGYHAVRITIDSGAEGNMMRESTATRLSAEIKPSSQSAHQADGSSPLAVVGEVRLTFTRDSKSFLFEGLVVRDLDVEVLAGTPFMELNDISVRPAKRQVITSDGTQYKYGSSGQSPGPQKVRRASVLRAPNARTTIWPGDFVEISLPQDMADEHLLALEPRSDCPSALSSRENMWPEPAVIANVAGKIRIPNLSDVPQFLQKYEHFCQVRPVYIPDSVTNIDNGLPNQPTPPMSKSTLHSSTINLDHAHTLPDEVRSSFMALHKDYDTVFSPEFQGYNGAEGPLKAIVNMGPVLPPQRKGRLPQYSKDKLVELQNKFDILEQQGVFARPENLGVTVEYLNPSFLVKKPTGGHRLVTAFSDVGRYSKPQPSLMPNVDSTLRNIAQWKFIICTDLTSAFYQIPLDKDSVKYCGVVTPFRGVRAYVRSAMGMPGSETALEELMCRVLGDLLTEGVVTKLADDLFCGGNTPQELLNNWTRVLQALDHCGLKLSPSKTIICPEMATILGWRWSSGTLSATPHRVSALASCQQPKTVRQLRSFVGAYKVLARVLPNCASILAPLDDLSAGKQSQDQVTWDERSCEAFKRAQVSLSGCQTITLPQPGDQLWIVTDGAVTHGVGATLYVTRNGQPRLAGFFSAKLRERQVKWLPCEIEALSIALAIKHFSPYIIQSQHKACILTDSKPCVQAFDKLCRGEFSASPRVSTFLSTASRYQASVRHLAGAANVPSDFASRNALPCENPPKCQVCVFVNQVEDSVVLRTHVSDIVEGKMKLPFTNRKTWLGIQSDCPDLRRTHAHLTQGTRPSKKATNIKDVKRYLNVATVSRDGLLVVPRDHPIAAAQECIIIPRQVLDGLLTALHLRLHHPSRSQLKTVVQRYFFALDMDSAITRVTEACHQCLALKQVPPCHTPQSTSCPPDVVGVSFATDIIKRNRQLIAVVRETVTSYTVTCLISNERHETLRDTLLLLCIGLRPLDGPPAIVRTDPASGFKTLVGDDLLGQQRMYVELGSAKNPNKNPVAERAVQEVEEELLRLNPTGGPVTEVELALATANLNSRIRGRGLSAREMWTQRDQFTACQLPLADQQLILEQHESRTANHAHSQLSKAPRSQGPRTDPSIEVGDIVYLVADKSKLRGRERYLVTGTDGPWCSIAKFTGAQLRSTAYRVPKSTCCKVPAHAFVPPAHPYLRRDQEDYPITETIQPTPPLPTIPVELSSPSDWDHPSTLDQTSCGSPNSPMVSLDSSSCASPSSDLVRGPIPNIPPEPPPDDSPPTERPAPMSPLTGPRRSERVRRPPRYLNDYDVDLL